MKKNMGLILSLMVNALLVGILLGPIARPPMPPMPMMGPGMHPPLIPGMSAAGQKLLDDHMQSQMAASRDNMNALETARHEMTEVMRRDKFDAAVFKAKREELDRLHTQMMQHFGTGLQDVLPLLSTEDRRALADQLSRMPPPPGPPPGM